MGIRKSSTVPVCQEGGDWPRISRDLKVLSSEMDPAESRLIR